MKSAIRHCAVKQSNLVVDFRMHSAVIWSLQSQEQTFLSLYGHFLHKAQATYRRETIQAD